MRDDSMRQAARASAMRFGLAETAKQLTELYQTLARGEA